MIDSRKERGDWQTPVEFARKCCGVVKNQFCFYPKYVIEPTCGIGNFIDAASEVFPGASIMGIEINQDYVNYAKERFSGNRRIDIKQADYLHDETSSKIPSHGSTLLLGNPPWANNSTLSALESSNVPEKSNFKGLRGIDAMTGKGNFDICEWIILRAISTCIGKEDLLAMLCKTSVARNVCAYLAKQGIQVRCTLFSFDSKKIFGVSVAACLLVCDFRASDSRIFESDIDDSRNSSELVFRDGALQETLSDELQMLQGSSVLQWRQGVKHDCAKAMELEVTEDGYFNRLGELVSVETEALYPYIKSSKSRQYFIDSAPMVIPMTQHYIGEDTAHIQMSAPRLWAYLAAHADLFEKRKSKIYKNAPQFAMFGVGDYSFAPYKVAVSGFYKDPVFSLLSGSKPIMLDDTCYFLPFYKESDARICMLLLNSSLVQRYYKAIAFLDSKRPFSKKILARLDFKTALDLVGLSGLNETAERLSADFVITEDEYNDFRLLVGNTLF